jgi:hypothetical protein
MRRPISLALSVAALAVTFACGGAKPPTYQLTQSKAAVRGAVEVGAKDTPQAALYLKMANDNIVEAEQLILDREYERARDRLLRAEADATLSIALAKEARARADAEEEKRKLQKLREETP